MLTIIKKFFEFLPDNAPGFIYTKILKPKPVLKLVNWIILKIIPRNIFLSSGKILFLNKKDPVISGAIAMGVYEKFEMSLFSKELGPGMTVIDVGANIGYYTIVAADAVGPAGTVICFEPDLESAEVLKKNIQVNEFKNIKHIGKGLLNRNGTIKFYLSKNNRGDNSICDPGDGQTHTEIETTTLDTVLPADTKINVIKMDIEGSETLALEGMEKSIMRSDNLTIFVEFSPFRIKNIGGSPIEFLQKLMTLGFVLYNINNSNRQLEQIIDIEKFSKQYEAGEYTNILGRKKSKKLNDKIYITSQGLNLI